MQEQDFPNPVSLTYPFSVLFFLLLYKISRFSALVLADVGTDSPSHILFSPTRTIRACAKSIPINWVTLGSVVHCG